MSYTPETIPTGTLASRQVPAAFPYGTGAFPDAIGAFSDRTGASPDTTVVSLARNALQRTN
jgi:hypothetical protein